MDNNDKSLFLKQRLKPHWNECMRDKRENIGLSIFKSLRKYNKSATATKKRELRKKKTNQERNIEVSLQIMHWLSVNSFVHLLLKSQWTLLVVYYVGFVDTDRAHKHQADLTIAEKLIMIYIMR